MSFLEVLISCILSIIYDSLIALLLVHFFLSLFRIKDSNIRILFFFIPLVKPLLVITERVDIERSLIEGRTFSAGFRMPNPYNLFRLDDFSTEHSLISFSETSATISVIVFSIISAFVIIRWLHLGLSYRRIAYEERVQKEDMPCLFEIIEGHSKKLGIKPPFVSLTHRHYFSPFLIGVRNKTLVISPILLERLTQSEKETVIRHELSHIKRRDNLIGWFALILRDISFFNPFAHIAYYLIRSEQESGADKLLVMTTKKDRIEIAKNILNSILKYKDIKSSRQAPAIASPFLAFKLIGNKRLQNRINVILNFNPRKFRMRLFPRIMMSLLFVILLFFFQVVLFINIGDFILFIR